MSTRADDERTAPARIATTETAPARPTDVYDPSGQAISHVEPAADSQHQALKDGERTIELREEEFVPQKEVREVGEITVRTKVEEVPGRIEIEALREEVEVEHVPAGEVVSERKSPWEEGDTLVIPVYEEQLVVVKRLYLREHLRIRRVATRERQVFEDTLRKERIVVEDPSDTGLVHEQYSRAGSAEEQVPGNDPQPPSKEQPGFFENLVKKALQ